MINIRLNSKAYEYKNLLINFLEEEIDDLRLYYDFEIIEDDDLYNIYDVKIESNFPCIYFEIERLSIEIRNVLNHFLDEVN